MNKYSGLNFLRHPVDIPSPLLLNFILFLYFIILPFLLANKGQEHYISLLVEFVRFVSLNIGLLIKVRSQHAYVAPELPHAKLKEILVFCLLAMIF